MDIIYLDYNATTPVDPAVLSRMQPFFDRYYGNPSSKGHPLGWAADEALTIAREELAELLGGQESEIIFTAGATEALNTAIKGIAKSRNASSPHVVTTVAEHSAVVESCLALEREGVAVTYLPVDKNGLVSVEQLEDAITPSTVLVAIMWANNEIGSINAIDDLAAATRKHDVLFLTDATQAVGKIPVSVEHVDLLACSAHKFYGPKGSGALWIRAGVEVPALIHGGGQEGGIRSGTVNVPGAVGLGAAASVALGSLAADASRLRKLRDHLEEAMSDSLPVTINARGADRLPQTSSVTFSGVRAANLLAELRGLALSAGSACSSGTGKPSRVLKSIGLSDADALSTIRFSLGRFSSEEDIDTAISMVTEAYNKVRESAPASI